MNTAIGKSEEEVIRSMGCRVTEGRVKLLRFLKVTKKPLFVKDISIGIGDVMDQATLYRALDAFSAAGILRKFHMNDSDALYYELVREHHHHIVCTECGLVEDFSETACEVIMKSALKFSTSFRSLDAHTVELSGVCKNCNK